MTKARWGNMRAQAAEHSVVMAADVGAMQPRSTQDSLQPPSCDRQDRSPCGGRERGPDTISSPLWLQNCERGSFLFLGAQLCCFVLAALVTQAVTSLGEESGHLADAAWPRAASHRASLVTWGRR